jgi:diguanylate cyclase (GGDEF)-like protein
MGGLSRGSILLKRVFISALLALYSLSSANAQEASTDLQFKDNMDIADFIAKAYTPTFDCPSKTLNANIDKALALTTLSPQQNLQLTSMKTHGLICAGKSTEAEIFLQRLLANEFADRSAQYYLSAIFQYGFIYDLKENPERCDYYILARDSAKDKFADVYLSASLGFITECIRDDVNKQLFGISQLLEITTRMNDPAALAHAYNRVALFYADRGQNRLAALQYVKAYETGKEIYTDENLLAILGSAMTAYTASGDLLEAKKILDKFITINANVDNEKTNFIEYYSKARYYTAVKDYENLKLILENFKQIVIDDQNPVHQGVYRRYTAALCYHNKDTECLTDFLDNEKNAPTSYLNYVSQSKSYLQFIVEINIFLGDKESSALAFADYVKIMRQYQKMLEDNNATFDVISLHDKILNLETTLKVEEEKRNLLAWIFVSALLVVLLFILWCVRRKYLESKSYDSLTGVLKESAVIKKLTDLPKPTAKCTNALAIFDVANFMDVNSILGSINSDLVLQQIANTLKNITRSSDLLGRFGEQQFILCLVNINEDAAQAFFERAKEALANTFADQNSQHAISVDSSMSILYSSETFSDIDEIIKNMLLSLSMKAEQA